jgi:hypothetical protein
MMKKNYYKHRKHGFELRTLHKRANLCKFDELRNQKAAFRSFLATKITEKLKKSAVFGAKVNQLIDSIHYNLKVYQQASIKNYSSDLRTGFVLKMARTRGGGVEASKILD